MKTIRLFYCMLMCMLFQVVHSQLVVSDPASLAQSITNTTQQIIQTSATANNTLQSFKELEKLFMQTKQYYDKLLSVNTLIKNYAKVNQSIDLLWQINEQYLKDYTALLQHPSLSRAELRSIEKGYVKVIEKAHQAWGELSLFITPSTLSLNDKQRLDAIQMQHQSIQQCLSLVIYIGKQSHYVANQRKTTSVATTLASKEMYQRYGL